MKTQLLITIALLVFITSPGQAQNLEVTQFEFATSVEDRQPMEVDTVFAADIGNVYCFTRLQGAQDSTKITHVWYYKEDEKARIELDVKSNDWRTWSSKTIMESWTGNWRVMIEDSDGNVLESKTFVIQD